MAKLNVNAFYGSIHAVTTDSVDPDEIVLELDLDPFAGSERGAVPLFLSTPLAPLIRDGFQGKRGSSTITIKGEQISRSLQFYALLETLKTLAVMCKDLDQVIQVNIRKCGRLGNYSLRYLIGLSNTKVNFIDFPIGWAKKLKDLQPIADIMTHVIRHPARPQEASSNIVSFDFDEKSDVREELEEDTDSYNQKLAEESRSIPSRKKKNNSRPVVDNVPAKSPLLDLTESEPTDEVEELPNDDDLESANEADYSHVAEEIAEEVKAAPKKRVTRKKAVEDESEEQAKPAPKKRVTRKKATPASEEKLAQLATKFNS